MHLELVLISKNKLTQASLMERGGMRMGGGGEQL